MYTEFRTVAIHEAAHAVAARALGVEVHTVSVFVGDDGQVTGEVTHAPTDTATRGKIALAGWVAERRARDLYVEEHRDDIRAGRRPVPFWAPNMSMSADDRAAVDAWLYEAYGADRQIMGRSVPGDMYGLLGEVWDEVEAVADALEAKSDGGRHGATLSGLEFEAAAKGQTMTPTTRAAMTPQEARSRADKMRGLASEWQRRGQAAPAEFNAALAAMDAIAAGRSVDGSEKTRRLSPAGSVWVR